MEKLNTMVLMFQQNLWQLMILVYMQTILGYLKIGLKVRIFLIIKRLKVSFRVVISKILVHAVIPHDSVALKSVRFAILP